MPQAARIGEQQCPHAATRARTTCARTAWIVPVSRLTDRRQWPSFPGSSWRRKRARRMRLLPLRGHGPGRGVQDIDPVVREFVGAFVRVAQEQRALVLELSTNRG